jgi:hypothetical protein
MSMETRGEKVEKRKGKRERGKYRSCPTDIKDIR